jgi:hypothetical protein
VVVYRLGWRSTCGGCTLFLDSRSLFFIQLARFCEQELEATVHSCPRRDEGNSKKIYIYYFLTVPSLSQPHFVHFEVLILCSVVIYLWGLIGPLINDEIKWQAISRRPPCDQNFDPRPPSGERVITSCVCRFDSCWHPPSLPTTTRVHIRSLGCPSSPPRLRRTYRYLGLILIP